MSQDAALLSLRGRIGAHVLHSRYDSRELTAPGRRAFLQKFLDEVDPSGTLDVHERERRAAHLRTAYFQRLAFASAKARRARGQNGGGK